MLGVICSTLSSPYDLELELFAFGRADGLSVHFVDLAFVYADYLLQFTWRVLQGGKMSVHDCRQHFGHLRLKLGVGRLAQPPSPRADLLPQIAVLIIR